jgi:heme/copper-type cytochrome/quinol oxidase subunit 2
MMDGFRVLHPARNVNTLRWLAIAVVGLAILLVPFPARSASPDNHTIRIEAESFEFTPAVFRVNPMDRVTIQLVSKDVVHGIYIDGYGLEVTADPGQIASLSFLADRPGTFRYRCSVTCGALHPFMIGKIQVGPNQLLWRGIGLAFLAVLAGIWSFRR